MMDNVWITFCAYTYSYSYKIALRKEKMADKRKQTEEIYSDLLNRDNQSFWKKWNSLKAKGENLT